MSHRRLRVIVGLSLGRKTRLSAPKGTAGMAIGPDRGRPGYGRYTVIRSPPPRLRGLGSVLRFPRSGRGTSLLALVRSDLPTKVRED